MVQVFAHGEGEATVTAYTAEGLTAEFTITASISPDRVFANGEKGKEPSFEDGTEGTSGEENAKAWEQKKGGGIWSTVLLILGALLLGAAVFFLTLKIAGGSNQSKKK